MNLDRWWSTQGRYIGDGHEGLKRSPLRFAEAPTEYRCSLFNGINLAIRSKAEYAFDVV